MESVAPICQALDEKFAMQERFLKDNFIDPMTAKVNSLADQMERMDTKEELGQLRSEVATQLWATRQLKLSFDSLYQHVLHSCPSPSAGHVIGMPVSVLVHSYSCSSKIQSYYALCNSVSL